VHFFLIPKPLDLFPFFFDGVAFPFPYSRFVIYSSRPSCKLSFLGGPAKSSPVAPSIKFLRGCELLSPPNAVVPLACSDGSRYFLKVMFFTFFFNVFVPLSRTRFHRTFSFPTFPPLTPIWCLGGWHFSLPKLCPDSSLSTRVH